MSVAGPTTTPPRLHNCWPETKNDKPQPNIGRKSVAPDRPDSATNNLGPALAGLKCNGSKTTDMNQQHGVQEKSYRILGRAAWPQAGRQSDRQQAARGSNWQKSRAQKRPAGRCRERRTADLSPPRPTPEDSPPPSPDRGVYFVRPGCVTESSPPIPETPRATPPPPARG